MKLALALLFASSAVAETLAPTASPTDWTVPIVVFLALAIIVFGVWYTRHNPGSVAKAEAKAATLQEGLASVAIKATEGLHRLTETHAEAVAKIPAPAAPESPTAATPAAEATPAAPAGKNGVAGILTLQVTGDPATDAKAFNTAYFS